MRELLILLTLSIPALSLQAQKATLVIPIGHSVEVTSVAYAPNGQYVLTGGMDNTARMWNARTGQLVKILKGHNNPVSKVAFAPDGQRMLTLERGASITLHLWDKNGNPTDTLSDRFAPITAAIFSPDSHHLLTGHQNGEVRLLSLDEPGFPVVRAFTGASQAITALSMDDNGRVLAAGKGHVARLYQPDGKLINVLTGHSGAINTVAFSPDGSRIATGCDAEQVILWGEHGEKLEKINRHKDEITSNAFSPDGKYFATASEDGNIFIWSRDGKNVGKAQPFGFGVNGVAWSPDSKFLLAGGDEKDAVLLNTEGKIVRRFTGHSSAVRSVEFSADGKYLLTGGNAQHTRLWHTDSRAVQAFPVATAYNAPSALAPDGSGVLIADESKTAKLWSFSGAPLKEYKRFFDGSASCLAYSPNGRYLALGNYAGQVTLWASEGKAAQKPIQAHERAISCLSFSPDSRYFLSGQQGLGGQGAAQFASGNQDISFSLMDNSGQPIAMWDTLGTSIGKFGSTSMLAAFSPDGQFVATDSQGSLKLWNIDGSFVREWEHDVFDASISALAFSPDSKSLLVGYQDGQARMWDIGGPLQHGLHGHDGAVLAAAFSANGMYAITGSDDNSAIVWETASGRGIVKLIALDTKDWVAITPDGFFDASPGAMEGMYYVAGLEIIALEQLKGRYYKPGLVQRLLGPQPEAINGGEALDTVSLFPDASLSLDGDKLSIALTPRNGGLGQVSVFVNQREAIADANPERLANITVDLAPYAGYCLADSAATVSAITRNAGGWLASQPYTIPWKPASYVGGRGEADAGDSGEPQFATIRDPNIYVLCIGTSQYAGEGLTLKYPDKDAWNMKEALQAASNRLLEGATGKVQAYLLSTDASVADKTSSKQNIRETILEIGKQAKAEDILVLYFSGHGTTYGAGEENAFYYLTKDVATMDLADPGMRNNYAISTDTLTEWLKAVKALKQAIIFDACHSGKAVEEISSGKKALDMGQILALDRMKDRTGTFILSGSAADKVSYEASQYGQGLLTYSLLEGMSGQALRDRKFVDVVMLFQYAIDRVPHLAESIGGIQKPEMASPKGGASFDIGQVDNKVNIPLARERPVFIRSTFLNLNTLTDNIGLSESLSGSFEEVSARGPNPEFIYIDVSQYRQGVKLSGLYTESAGTISIEGKVQQAGREIGSFSVDGNKDNMPGLAQKVIQAALAAIAAPARP